jgi:hypothetical protein
VFADPRSTWTCKDCNAGQQWAIIYF